METAPPPPRIEPATAADVPAIVARWADLLGAHRTLEPRLFRPAAHSEGTYAAFVRRLIDRREAVVLVARGPGEPVVGYLLGGPGQITIATLIETMISELLNWGLGATLSVLLLVVVSVIFVAFSWVMGLERLTGGGSRT